MAYINIELKESQVTDEGRSRIKRSKQTNGSSGCYKGLLATREPYNYLKTIFFPDNTGAHLCGSTYEFLENQFFDTPILHLSRNIMLIITIVNNK